MSLVSISRAGVPTFKPHRNARDTVQYSTTQHQRFVWPSYEKWGETPWSADFHAITEMAYEPNWIDDECRYTADGRLHAWADEATPSVLQFNEVDRVNGGVDRRSFCGPYQLDKKTGMPLNPFGRTGVTGPGVLGRYGPNHAADPIVFRPQMRLDPRTGRVGIHFLMDPLTAQLRPLMEFVTITRSDTNEEALPGGMLNANEMATAACKRELGEEAFAYPEEASEEELAALKARAHADVQTLFSERFPQAVEVYRGYVDDPRNTDSSWIETRAYGIDAAGLPGIVLKAGSDAVGAKWSVWDPQHPMKLYASHTPFVEAVYNNIFCDRVTQLVASGTNIVPSICV